MFDEQIDPAEPFTTEGEEADDLLYIEDGDMHTLCASRCIQGVHPYLTFPVRDKKMKTAVQSTGIEKGRPLCPWLVPKATA